MTQLHRRRHGYTKGPCPGCRKGDDHPSGGVCHDCEQAIAIGREFVRTQKAKKDRGWFRFSTQCPHWNNNYYLAYVHYEESGFEGTIADAFAKVVESIADPSYSFSSWSRDPGEITWDPNRFRNAGDLLTRLSDRDSSSHQDRVQITVAQADALNELDRVMVRAIVMASQASFTRGTDLLQGLASGDVSMKTLEQEVANTAESTQRTLKKTSRRKRTQ